MKALLGLIVDNLKCDLTSRGCVSACVARVLEWHSRGHGFDPHRLHQEIRNRYDCGFFLYADLLKFFSACGIL